MKRNILRHQYLPRTRCRKKVAHLMDLEKPSVVEDETEDPKRLERVKL